MVRLNRRDVLASLAACVVLASKRAHASCDVWRDTVSNVDTKSYQCSLADGQTLTTTFMRLSDVMFDSVGGPRLPGRLGDVQDLIRGHRLIETPALETFTRLFEKHSIAFEDTLPVIRYDGRDSANPARRIASEEDNDGTNIDLSRWRTLGYWNDETGGGSLPIFPDIDLLNRALVAPSNWDEGVLEFVRYANRSDFLDLDRRKAEYIRMWSESSAFYDGIYYNFGQLDMLSEIDAGSLDEFMPLMYARNAGFFECNVDFGCYYVPPALYVDVMVCRNDGVQDIVIDDFVGAIDSVDKLRFYSPSTPTGNHRFGWAAQKLAPGESLLAVQRLLFRAADDVAGLNGVTPKGAVYGPTHLPKGVVVGGQIEEFDGRSHNVILLASYGSELSCPYLESWCPNANEWIEHGKVLTRFTAPEKAGSDTRDFGEVRTRFRISEREHEDTVLTAAELELVLRDGSTLVFAHPDASARLSVGEAMELSFDVPAKALDGAVRSSLTLRGHYQKFGSARIAALIEKLAS